MNISYKTISIFLCLVSLHYAVGLRRSLVYQMDVSEHCRRRVIPSIFLAGNVIDANSYILHFSQTELPYTCYISVRAEAGSNIVMVTSLTAKYERTNRFCNANVPELLVYEMGETFGGYWGPLSDNLINTKDRGPDTKLYTLKTTTASTTEISTEEIKTTETTTSSSEVTYGLETEFEDVINVEVPLVNVSAEFVYSLNETRTTNPDETFDLDIDVTPEPGKQYDTSVIPLVQFAIRKSEGQKENQDQNTNEFDARRYDLDIVEPYTLDWRLTWPHSRYTTLRNKKLYPKRYRPKNRLFFKKGKTTKSKFPLPSNNVTEYIFPTTQNLLTVLPSLPNKTHYSWEFIEELIKRINETEAVEKDQLERKNADLKFLEKIANLKLNSSFYLYPNKTIHNLPWHLSTLTTKKLHNIVTMRTLFHSGVQTEDVPTLTGTLKKSIEAEPSIMSSEFENINNTTFKEIRYNSYYKSVMQPNLSTPVYDKDMFATPVEKSLVQENADALLNTSVHRNASDDKQMLNVTQGASSKRSKREVHAIEIEDARPHNVTTKKMKISTDYSFGVKDMQEFGQLVELSDDDMYGHVALRYLRQYVGSVYYNICMFDEKAKRQHVQLFNSSRIVLAITNLSNIVRMKLVLTAARTLMAAELRCPGNDIECQVSGARVCIDATSACDGVPNCGSYEIYDEDRLRCGASQGLEHNVYIAAFTFVAVLVTALYAVHYWLKRCVPQVAEAFFVYTDASDNILYLNSIMRSPHDDSEAGPLFYHPNMFEDLGETFVEKQNLTIWQKFVNIICCRVCKKQENTEIEDDFEIQKEVKRKYSFAEFEINKMSENMYTDMSVQTGSSLELQRFEKRIEKRSSVSVTSPVSLQDSILTLEEPFPEDYVDELSLLKFLNETKRPSDDSMINTNVLRTIKEDVKNNHHRDTEYEITSHTYDSHRNAIPGPSIAPPVTRDIARRIRFDETATKISTEQRKESNSDDVGPRRSTYLDKGAFKKFLDTINEDSESSALQNKEYTVTNKEHKSFWGKSKAKKPKKSSFPNKR